MDDRSPGPRRGLTVASKMVRRVSSRFHRARSPRTEDTEPPTYLAPAMAPVAPSDHHYIKIGALLALPREIRDQILAYVTQQHQNDPTAIVQNFDELTRGRKIPNKPQLASWTKIVLHNPEGIRANATGLLLSSHQLRSETLETIDRLDARVYELDVIVLDETLPILTWLHVPFFTDRVDKVNVTFRISGSYDEARMHQWQPQSDDKLAKRYATYDRYKGFRGYGDGSSSCHPLAMQLYSILERFIKAGPVGDMSKDCEHRHVVVKAINMKVERPSHIDPALYAMPRSSTGSTIASGSVLKPSFLAVFIGNSMATLLAGTQYDAFWFGKIIFEHVDSISISLGDRKLRTIDVAEKLEALKYFSFDEERFSVEEMEEYKTITWRLRKERGLKCLYH
ncbi:hypothetical protein DE146DRAFT_626937 [Phaeosphaeria sp. MPI-PUGE-AT-0046c]|nr:hypothetical protein DE146DRAFT_626937 [Phaeosphaeria sp. MPI-PUGE-AT-0046c]